MSDEGTKPASKAEAHPKRPVSSLEERRQQFVDGSRKDRHANQTARDGE